MRSDFTNADCDPELRKLLIENRSLIRKHAKPTVDGHVPVWLRGYASEMDRAADRIEQLEEALRHHTGCTDVDRLLKDSGRYPREEQT